MYLIKTKIYNYTTKLSGFYSMNKVDYKSQSLYEKNKDLNYVVPT